MLILSDQIKSISSKIYTFSFMSIAVKYLVVEGATVFGFRISLENKEVIAGALTLMVAALVLAAIPCLIRDYMTTVVLDESALADAPEPDGTMLKVGVRVERTFLEKHFRLYASLGNIVSAVEAIIPILLGGFIVFTFRDDVVLLFNGN